MPSFLSVLRVFFSASILAFYSVSLRSFLFHQLSSASLSFLHLGGHLAKHLIKIPQKNNASFMLYLLIPGGTSSKALNSWVNFPIVSTTAL
jgi:hypothetical protein